MHAKHLLREIDRMSEAEWVMTLADFRNFLGSKVAWTFTLSAAALGGYLLLTHSGHVVAALPFVILLLCPLMHLFGHHHGHHNKREHGHE